LTFYPCREDCSCPDVVTRGEPTGDHQAVVVEEVAHLISVTIDPEELFEVDELWGSTKPFECVVGLLFAVRSLDAKHRDFNVFCLHSSDHGLIRKCISLISSFFEGNINDVGRHP
jgi:hypothetical protein